jgi:hypothetical protein
LILRQRPVPTVVPALFFFLRLFLSSTVRYCTFLGILRIRAL